MSKQVELVKGSAFELNPSKKYLLVFQRGTMDPVEIKNLSTILMNEGILNLAVIIDGPMSSMKIVEAEGDAN